MTNAIDLTTVAAVNAILEQDPSVDAALIQSFITNYSQNVLTRCSRGNLSQIKTYSELYSGAGGDLQMLRNYPVLAVTSLAIGGISIPASPGQNQPGYVIDESGSQAAIAMRGGGRYSNWSAGETPWRGGGGNAPPLGLAPYRFFEGRSNVAVTYQAGYALEVPAELQTVPVDSIAGAVTSGAFVDGETITQATTGATATLLSSTLASLSVATVTGSADGTHAWTGSTSDAVFTPTSVPTAGPYTVACANAAAFWADLGVTDASGAALQAVASAPGPGQYVPPAFGVAPLGVYTFNAAQAAATLTLAYQYGGTPYDLAEAAGRLVAVQYRRRQWLGQVSQMQPGVGTTAYSRLETELDTKAVIERYKARFSS